MGQCTVPLKDKMKEDPDWHNISDKYDHIRLLLLIKKTVLKQTESKNPYQRVQDEMRALLNFQQAARMNNNDFYRKPRIVWRLRVMQVGYSIRPCCWI